MKKLLFAIALGMSAGLAALAEGAPRIEFEQTVYDFGKTSGVASVSGAFKYKNTGDAVLKIEPPKPSCGCTLAEMKPDTLQPGESGELGFTLHLGQNKALFDKHISVKSNDPKTPEVTLSIKADYTPLYTLEPRAISPVLAFGVSELTEHIALTRTDGKPLAVAKLVPTQRWITAKLDPDAKTESTAKIRITIQRDGPPRRFNEFIQVYVPEQTNAPVASLSIIGQMLGAVSLAPEALYWNIAGPANARGEHPDAQVLKRVTIQSADGKPIELRNPQSTIKGLKVDLFPKEAGKVYELVARLEEIPTTTISGKVSVETSAASQSKVELPVIVNVSKP